MWRAIGPVVTYIDPFCGLLAVPLACPWGPRKREIVNDADGLVVNVFRAVRAAPQEVAAYVDWPVSELDMLARRDELVRRRAEVRAKLRANPRWYDAELAGWWLFGACCWIGGGWAAEAHVGLDGQPRCEEKRPVLSRPARGVLKAYDKLPAIGRGGQRGILKARGGESRPVISGARHGVLRGMGGEKRPQIASLGLGVLRPGLDFQAHILLVAERIRRMKIVSGDWLRVLGDSTLGIDTAHGCTPTGIFLDPPYAHAVRSKTRLYAHDSATISTRVRRWALEHGDDPRLRVVLAGYAEEHGPHMPPSWRCIAWKSQSGTKNADQERLWLSPHCLGGTSAEPLFRDVVGP